MKWNLTMFSVIFCEAHHWILSNTKGTGLRRRSPCSKLDVFIDLDETVSENGEHKILTKFLFVP